MNELAIKSIEKSKTDSVHSTAGFNAHGSLSGNLWEDITVSFYLHFNSVAISFTNGKYKLATAKLETLEDLYEVFNFLKTLKVNIFDAKQMQVLFNIYCEIAGTESNQEDFIKFCEERKIRIVHTAPKYKVIVVADSASEARVTFGMDFPLGNNKFTKLADKQIDQILFVDKIEQLDGVFGIPYYILGLDCRKPDIIAKLDKFGYTKLDKLINVFEQVVDKDFLKWVKANYNEMTYMDKPTGSYTKKEGEGTWNTYNLNNLYERFINL